ncbi:hypothetical protein EZV62_022205 [Acer yangbiense]|uniref:Uncharacterized protein n=1 Tax=Acer yangbiense TaxID=1000413 RepID=A0A5C7HA15_9ROSI|nr:hypothetical protein EZV62_022205 [Acer yangbiense]
MTTTTLLLSTPPFISKPPYFSITTTTTTTTKPFFPSPLKFSSISVPSPKPHKSPFIVRADEGDGDSGGPDDYDMDEEEVDELDNKRDYDVEYDPLASSSAGGLDEDITMVDSKSFVFTQGWDSEMVVDYRIDEDEFHKISLMECDFFIRKPPDPDNDVYDFREMYVTPPDTDIYAVPKVLAPMPQKYIRCAKSDYGCYNVTEPPIDAPRDPMYKSDREIHKVTLPRNRDRKSDLLVIRDNGNSFRIIHASERDDPTTVIEREEWVKSREDMERHLSKLRDFSISNWF